MNNPFLKKAFQVKDLARIKNKTDSAGESAVDHESHAKEHPAPKAFTDAANSELIHKGEGIRKYGGISAKMVHKISEDQSDDTDTYMSKPYHKKIESATKGWVKHPILGWATMATKSLFHAADMKDNIEEVYTHVHDGTPLTVHKFAPYHITTIEASRLGRTDDAKHNRDFDLQARKIAAMDFLTGNVDRHWGNLMFDRGSEKHLLAIDHERSFQYHKPISEIVGFLRGGDADETPNSYLKRATGEYTHSKWIPENTESLRKWWLKNSDKIRKAFHSELAKIKDPNIRAHVAKNFEERHSYISDWAENDGGSLFHIDRPSVTMHKMPKPKISTKDMLANLPQDPMQAVKLIDAALRKKRASPSKLLQAWKDTVSKMSPQQKVSYYSSSPYHHLDNHGNGAAFGLLKHVLESNDIEGMRALANHEHTPSFWKEKYAHALGDKAA